MPDKSIYEMTQEELADFTPAGFNEAYIKSMAPLVEEWQKTTWLNPNGANGTMPGATQQERDLNVARMARIMQNYVDMYFPARRETHVTASEMVKKVSQMLPENGKMPETSLEFGEAAGIAQTTSWSGATLLPMVLGYVRKLMPKLYGQQFYQVQPLDRPSGRVFFVARNRDNNNSTDGQIEQRAGWSYRSWISDPGEATAITKAVTFTITSADVPTPKSRKLQASTSIEVEQDKFYACPLAA